MRCYVLVFVACSENLYAKDTLFPSRQTGGRCFSHARMPRFLYVDGNLSPVFRRLAPNCLALPGVSQITHFCSLIHPIKTPAESDNHADNSTNAGLFIVNSLYTAEGVMDKHSLWQRYVPLVRHEALRLRCVCGERGTGRSATGGRYRVIECS